MLRLRRELQSFDHTDRDDGGVLVTRRRPRVSGYSGQFFGAAWAGALVAGALIATNNAMELIPLVAIAAPVVLLWRPISALTRRSEEHDAPQEDTDLEQRVALLEKQLDTALKQQSQLRDMVLWQERLLHRTTGEASEPDPPNSR
jgi:apolipoprotein N-acyltransferase